MYDDEIYEGSPKQVSWAKSIMRDYLKNIDPSNLSLNDMFCLGLTDASLIIDNRDSLSKEQSGALANNLKVEWMESSQIEEYTTFLLEKYRSPSKGGNTSALHSHRLVVNGAEYYFKARGAKKWIFKSDTFTFAFYVKDGRNMIIKGTIVTHDKYGKDQVRGDRRAKNVLRTASQRLPCSRREARN
ncbi:TPA: hypothetical protein NGV42_004574 [Vibrio parahaemolyticus]|nr:hypothetical protein [Vibrio parahaemolyticus]HCE2818463.1 hypothetical protein [Vibrio parahaemolyticus]HCG7534227.1 hypothetical protein [Vibrio parahaemolyticus]HCG8238756.1 hypothetical protein [Vibrio parahaemolyticus]